MTRINLVEPQQLTDKHLMAEYRELPRIFTAVLKLQEQGKSPADVDIPDRYTLGKGHMKFFYGKIDWLRRRYTALAIELELRGFNIDRAMFNSVCFSTLSIGTVWYGELYEPTPEEIYLNMVRLCKRSNIPSVLEELHSE